MKKLFLVFLSVAFFLSTTFAQGNKIPLIGSKAPSFKSESTNGNMTFPEDFGKSWKILFSHPQDFTPVCSSELLELAYMNADFEKLNTKVAVISTDDVTMHKLWKAQLQELDYKGRGPQKIEFPIIDDHKAVASKKYGMIHDAVSTNKDIRGVFIIDSNNIVRSINFYPMEIGRNMNEITRILEALQTADKEKLCTPANWVNGEDLIVPRFPYTDKELAENPKLKDDYYSVGNRMWFKKVKHKGSL